MYTKDIPLTLVAVFHLPNRHFHDHFYRHNDLRVQVFQCQHYVSDPYDVRPLYYRKDFGYHDVVDDVHPIRLDRIDYGDNELDTRDDLIDSIPGRHFGRKLID